MNVKTRTLFGTCSPAAHIKAFCSGCWVEYVLAANKRSLYISEQCLRSIQVWEQIIFRDRFVYINTSSVTRGRRRHPRRHRVISVLRGWAFYFLNLVLSSSLQQENRNWDKYFTAQRSNSSRGTCVSITGRADERSPSTLSAPPVKNNALNELSSRWHGLCTLAHHPSHPLGKSQCADSGGNQYTWNSAVEPSEWMQICGGRKFLQVSYSRRREHIQQARWRARQWRSLPARWVAFRATHPHTLTHARACLLYIADLDTPVQRHFLAQMREEIGLQSISLWEKHKFKKRTSLSH